MRNLKREFSGKGYSQMRTVLDKIRLSSTIEEGRGYFRELVELVKDRKEVLEKIYEEKEENYLAFLRYPEEIRKHIYTTNPVESINAGLERIRKDLGGYFPSMKSLEVNLFIQLSNLNDSWMRRPIPAIRSNLYRLKQIMRMKFGDEGEVV